VTGAWVITGAGLVSSAGSTADQLFGSFLDGAPRDGPAEGPANGALPIRDFDARRYLERKGLQHLSRTSQLACAAASLLRPGLQEVPPCEVGVVFGTAWASLDTIVRFERAAYIEGARFVDPLLFTETVANVPAGQISICCGWSALNMTLVQGTASGLEAIHAALWSLEQNRARVVVAGGGDELNHHLLQTLRAERGPASASLAPGEAEASAVPVGGEGACLFAIESAASALERGARQLARIGGAVSARFDPAGPRGPADMIGALLGECALERSEIDLVILSANGCPGRARAEAAALREVFAEAQPPALLPKALLGETWGASAPLAVVLAAESMRRSVIPPVAAWPRAGSDLAVLSPPREALHRAVRNAIVLDCSETGRASALLVSAK
jgi:3-oxoacyl-[acyl-carrier-protein] synthase II